jgi:hypothetical protein
MSANPTLFPTAVTSFATTTTNTLKDSDVADLQFSENMNVLDLSGVFGSDKGVASAARPILSQALGRVSHCATLIVNSERRVFDDLDVASLPLCTAVTHLIVKGLTSSRFDEVPLCYLSRFTSLQALHLEYAVFSVTAGGQRVELPEGVERILRKLSELKVRAVGNDADLDFLASLGDGRHELRIFVGHKFGYTDEIRAHLHGEAKSAYGWATAVVPTARASSPLACSVVGLLDARGKEEKGGQDVLLSLFKPLPIFNWCMSPRLNTCTVRVAIIDTGVQCDVLPPHIHQRIRSGMSFVETETWFTDPTRHGTAVLTICGMFTLTSSWRRRSTMTATVTPRRLLRR